MPSVPDFFFVLILSIAVLFAPLHAEGASISSFDFSLEALSPDFEGTSLLKASYARLEGAKYKPIGSPYLVWESKPREHGGLRLMLTCGEVIDSTGSLERLKNVQLLLVSEDAGAVRLVQRFKLGDGSSPQFLAPEPPAWRDASSSLDLMTAPANSDFDFMVRIMRSGNNTEAYLYFFDAAKVGLTETLRVNRSFQTKMGVKIRGTLDQDGFVDVVTSSPDKTVRVDLSEALNALIEDELYQLNGRPVPSMSSLTCVRNGWEGEGLFVGDSGAEARVGMTLITPSRKQVVDVTAVLTKNEKGGWAISDYLFEPFLPYRSW